MSHAPSSRSLATKFLHLLLLLSISHQLVTSWFMSRPRPGRSGSGGIGYELHETVGIVSLATLCLFWLWSVLRRREHGLGHLLPWFSSGRRQAFMNDLVATLRAAATFRLHPPADPSPFAGAIHGLGLIIATVMAGSGFIVFRSMAADGALSPTGSTALGLHKAAANLMWAYLIAHASLALLHEMFGHRVMARMFSFTPRGRRIDRKAGEIRHPSDCRKIG